jgi:hypothetical protein
MNAAHRLPCGCLIERDTAVIIQLCACCQTEICRIPRNSGGAVSVSDRQALHAAGRGHLVTP